MDQRTEDKGQGAEVLSRLCRALDIACRVAVHNNLSTALCPLPSVAQ